MSNKKPYITGEHFFYWVRCPYWAFLELHQSGGQRAEVSEMAKRLMEEGVKYEREFMERGLGVGPKEMKTVEVLDLEEAFTETIEYMESGVEWIYQGVLMDAHYVGRPDLLRKRHMPKGETSRFGDYYYEAIDIKSGRSIRPAYKLQVAFYSFILERIQNYRPIEGGIINIDADHVTFSIEAFNDRFQLTLSKIEAMMEGEEPPPFVSSGCKENPWEKSCLSRAQACDHVSLIYRIPKKTVEILMMNGIETVSGLAGQSADRIHALIGGRKDSSTRLITQAQSLRDNKPIELKNVTFPKATRELYFDIEGDPFEGVEYLFGFLDVDTETGEEKYRAFIAESPGEEEKMWKEVVEWLARIEVGTPIYHYADYERSRVRGLAERYGIPKAVSEVLENGLHDILETVRKSVVLPLYFYSLKDVARYLGFEWSHEKAGGAQSILWYQEWLESADRSILDTIMTYNEDDVRATRVIKEWLVAPLLDVPDKKG